MANLFKRGYKAAREEAERQETARANMSKKLFRFFLKDDGDEADVKFLTEEPITFMEHTVQVFKNGKTLYDSVTCSGENCPYCEDGNKPSFKGAFLIYDKRPYEVTDKSGKKKTIDGSVKLYVQGAKVLSQLDRLSERYGLVKRDYTIIRSGTGQNTTYMIERQDESTKLTSKQIENLLPEKLRDEYNGDMESLYTIIENQLEMNLPDAVDNEDDEDEEEYDNRKNLVGDDDEDEEDEERPVRNAAVKKSGSVKSLFKKNKKK